MVALTLGLGIGATTTIYSVVDAVLVRPLPYRDSDRLAIIGNTAPGNEWVEGSEGVQRLEVIALPAFRDAQSRANWGQTPISSFQCGHRVPHPKAKKNDHADVAETAGYSLTR